MLAAAGRLSRRCLNPLLPPRSLSAFVSSQVWLLSSPPLPAGPSAGHTPVEFVFCFQKEALNTLFVLEDKHA